MKTLAAALSVIGGAAPLLDAAAARPNIVVILADDMGFSDLGCYGSEIPTPHLDALAAHGLRYTQFYNTGRCCPSRAALLTGLYSHQAGVGLMVDNQGAPGYQGHLNDRCVTLAEVLGPAGYFTAMSGKWHVGLNPATRGFARSLSAGSGGFYYPFGPRAKLSLNGKPIANDDPALPEHWYTTDLYTDFGIKFIDEALTAKQPFLLYLAYNAPHFPLQAPAAEIAAFRGKYKAGWDALRLQRHHKQQQLGIVAADGALAPRPKEVKAWADLTDKDRDRFDEIMAIYAAAVAHMDTAIGRLVAALKTRGVLDDTLIVFMSDNGGNAEGGPQGIAEGANLGGADSKVFCGESWAGLENTPLRKYKHYNHEGGIATPLIVHWPKRIKEGGALRQQTGHLIDIMPTLVELAGAKYPKDFSGHAILPMEGISLVPTFSNKPLPRRSLFWEHEGNAAARQGDLKLVRAGRQGHWELYDLTQDRSELHNLAATQPDTVSDLAAQWEAWALRAQVRPYPGEKKDRPNKNH